MMKFSYYKRPGINPRAKEQRPINRAKTNRQARFIGRNFVAGRFIARRWRRTNHLALISIAILFIFLIIGCQAQEANNQQGHQVTLRPTENGELITAVPTTSDTQLATAEPATAVPPTEAPAEAAANADVTFVRAISTGDDTWTFHVTVDHPDTGWEDYADGWDVVLPDGSVVKPDETSPFTRLLLHPHETERPFTRSQSNIIIPTGITSVTVRAHDLVDGFGGKEVVVDLTAISGTDFEVTR